MSFGDWCGKIVVSRSGATVRAPADASAHGPVGPATVSAASDAGGAQGWCQLAPRWGAPLMKPP